MPLLSKKFAALRKSSKTVGLANRKADLKTVEAKSREKELKEVTKLLGEL